MRRTGTDLVVIGAGPAGLAAAINAAACGQRVVLVDRQHRAGGQIWRHRDPGRLSPGARGWIDRAAVPAISFRRGAEVLDAEPPDTIIIETGDGVEALQGQAIILATGARERLLPFPGWTLPGVTGIGGLQALLKDGLDLKGSRVVIAGGGPLIFPVAAAVVSAGAHLLRMVEQADLLTLARFAGSLWHDPGKALAAVRYRHATRRTPFSAGSWVIRADGDTRLREVTLQVDGRRETLACDWLATGFGLVPNIEIGALFGCRIEDDALVVDDEQQTSIPGIHAAGECTGIKGDVAALAEGEIAGRAAVKDATLKADRGVFRRRDHGRAFGRRLARLLALRPEVKGLATDDTIVCRCEGVPRGAIDPGWTQRQAKLWTRIGMGTCQGAVCGPACAALFGWERNSIRPPLGAPSCARWNEALELLE